jgi:hypothetical protein
LARTINRAGYSGTNATTTIPMCFAFYAEAPVAGRAELLSDPVV